MRQPTNEEGEAARKARVARRKAVARILEKWSLDYILAFAEITQGLTMEEIILIVIELDNDPSIARRAHEAKQAGGTR